jgi:mono/diheme cytochrome c family protein
MLKALLVCACLVTGCSSGSSTPSDQVARGKTLATQNACASCHEGSAGVLAGGARPASSNGSIYAPNLTPDTDTGIGSWSTDQIVKALRTGIDDENETLCSVMPRFELTDEEAASIAAYLKSLPAVSNEVPEGECSEGDAGADGG